MSNYSQFSDRFACFKCRKAFKPAKIGSYRRAHYSVVSCCPQCRGPVTNMGMDFRPPRQSNKKAWARLAADPKPFYGGGCRPPCCPRGDSLPRAKRLSRLHGKYDRPFIGKAHR